MSNYRMLGAAIVALLIGASTTPAFSVSGRGVAQGERETRALLRLMDTDQNGEVSKQEFMRFMEAEFDRLDVDHSGALNVSELSKFHYHAPTHPGGVGSR